MRIRSRATKSRWGPDENYGSTGCVWICNLLDVCKEKFKRKVGEEKPKRVNVQRRSYCPETLQIVINRK